jgi:cytolysin-activating lysine-acyltransferase
MAATMRFASAPGLDVIAPGLLQQEWREAEIFGAATWLWMHASTRRETPLKWLSTLLLPAIAHRQFLLATEGDLPVFYVSWANFSVAAENTYVNGRHSAITPADWVSGDRQWIIDWIAPFGHTASIWRLLQRQLFPAHCMRYLHHHGVERGFRIKRYHGIALNRIEADAWFAAHPVALDSNIDVELNPPSPESDIQI